MSSSSAASSAAAAAAPGPLIDGGDCDWSVRYSALLAQHTEFKADSEQVESELEAQLADVQQQLSACQRKLQQSVTRGEDDRSHSAQLVRSLEARVASLSASLHAATAQVERLRAALVAAEQMAETATNRLRASEAQCAAQQDTIESQTELLIMARQEMEDMTATHSRAQQQHRQHRDADGAGRDTETAQQQPKQQQQNDVAMDGALHTHLSVPSASPLKSSPPSPSTPSPSVRAFVAVSSPSSSSAASLLLSSLAPNTSHRLRDFIARTESLHLSLSPAHSHHSPGKQEQGVSDGAVSSVQSNVAPGVSQLHSHSHSHTHSQQQRRPGELTRPVPVSSQSVSDVPSPGVSPRVPVSRSSSPLPSPRSPQSAGGIRGMFAPSFAQSANAATVTATATATTPAQPTPVSASLSRLLSASASSPGGSSSSSSSGTATTSVSGHTHNGITKSAHRPRSPLQRPLTPPPPTEQRANST